jgi:hypothetical protein
MKSKESKRLLVIDFCNITEWSHTKIFDLQVWHDIIYSVRGRKRGFEDFCISKQDPRRRLFVLIEDQKFIDEKKKSEGKLPAKFFVLRSANESEELWEYLQASQKKFKLFLDHCSEGILSIQFMNEAVNNFNSVGLKFNQSANTWNSKISYNAPQLNSFEDYVYWDILNLFLLNNAENVLPYVKLCRKCNKYYIAKRHIQNQKFCSEKCRFDWHNHERIESGVARRYKRDRRKQGLDQ